MNLYYDIPISQIITDFSKHHRFLDFYTIPYSVEYIFLRKIPNKVIPNKGK